MYLRVLLTRLESRCAWFARVLPICIVLSFLLGLVYKDVARVSLVLLLLSQLRLIRVKAASAAELQQLAWAKYFPFTWLMLLTWYQFAQFKLGLLSFDFAIFSQLAQNFGTTGNLKTSFITGQPISFLTHHFSLIWTLPGLLVRFGFSGPTSVILVHSVGLGLGVYWAYRISVKLGLDSNVAAGLASVLCLSPSFWIGASWGVREEVMALPFIGAAYYYFLSSRYLVSALALLLCCLCKETFFVFSIVFALVAVGLRRRDLARDRTLIGYPFAAVLALLGIYFYEVSPLITRSFDPSARVSTWAEISNFASIKEKSSFLFRFFAPTALLFLFSRQARLLFIPAMVFLGSILVSNFDQMYRSYSYYSILPTYICWISGSIGMAEVSKRRILYWPGIIALLLALQLSLGSRFPNPAAIILRNIREPALAQHEISAIPKTSGVLAADADFPFLIDYVHVYRYWTASRVPLPWQYLLVRHDAKDPVPAEFYKQAILCRGGQTWDIWARKGKGQSCNNLLS